MKKYLFNTLFILAFVSFASAQSLDDVLKNYYEANGSDKLKAVNTLTMKGKSSQMGMETPFVIYFKRPNKIKTEVELMGSKLIQAFNGTDGWMVAPWTGTTDPQDMPAVMLKQIREQADFDGQLVNYKEKGYELELMGTEDMEGSSVFKLKLTNVKEGDITYYFLDPESYVIVKTSSKINMEGNDVEADTYFSNYKKYKGIYFPHQFESKSNGQTQSTVVISEIIFDEPMDDAVFARPAKK